MDEAKELHKRVINKFKKRRIITYGIDHIWAADLLIMTKYSKENNGLKYILVVIDTFSKYLWLKPVERKLASHVSSAFQKILSSTKRRPKFLHVDKGKEFVNKTFRNLLQTHNITMYHSESKEKSAIAERVNRTVNEKLKLYFEINKNHKWVTLLPKILKQYNQNDIHHTIGIPPAKVNKKNEKKILLRMFPLKKFSLNKPKLTIGDRVRLSKHKSLFENKYSRNWTREIFTVHKIKYTDPISYVIKDQDDEIITGAFYTLELQKTKF